MTDRKVIVEGAAVGKDVERLDTNTSIFEPPPMHPWQRRFLVISLGLSLFLGALDMTIIATALPTIANSLKVTSREYAWIGSGYTLATTASTPVWVKISDICGRKSSIMAAVTIFMVGSLVSALAHSSVALLAGRVVQGLGGGGSIVLVTVIIGDVFALADRPKYYAITGVAFALASAIGPVLGGAFTDGIGWRWCFYINLPFDGLVLILLFFTLNVTIEKESLTNGLSSIDWTGFLLIIGGTVCFLYGLETGSSGLMPWQSATVICLVVFGAHILVLFMVWEAKFAKNPIIPFRIFQKQTSIASFVVACFHSFIFISFDFFLPLYYQVVLGFSPLISGVTLFALIIPMSITTFASGLFVRKTGNYRVMILAGTILLTLGTGLFIDLGVHRSWVRIIIYEVVAGIGAGPLFQSPMIALQSHLRQADIAAAMSAFSFLRNLCTSLSIVIGTVLIQQTLHSNSLTTAIGDGSAADTDKQLYVHGLRNMWIFYACVASLTIVATCFIKPKALKKTESSEEIADVEARPEK
ncbi:Uncharacterized protein PECH_003176 [Penicillium ucsense]|uniref:Major facilitator superfamily (MFS) profile domain-containing protein n=1 Tax=Penicillium ucsense TaxID=2839758 RepID=A0A8J8W5G8_9EURO|nr:Uncharacterized protein PECM_004883 [Penicillium ucsense]KAF7737686.1 Uncharacterized protein PECH_003176 [Penicillium ucsense]